MTGSVLQTLFSLDTILALFIGTVGGLVIGALPGLSSTMGVALLIPMTYGMHPTAAIVMLAAVYTSAVYGGSISAILIHTPGTPASAATALDGYALTLQGNGLKAVGVSTISSVFGGVVSAFMLLLLAPPLARISLNFSSAEYFLMALFGLTIIGSLANESMIKGLIAGVFGLMAGLIGMSNTGYVRYSFGILSLSSGIALVPALIGLFSLSQVLIQSESRGKGELGKKAETIKGSFFPSANELKSLVPTVLRSTVIGVFIGILPGAGGDIASWVAYNETKRRSKNKSMFGKGMLEGVAAPEAANNAVTGGALIPLLTFGIPGSATAAVMLGGLTIQGLVPGWQLFSSYANVTYAIIIGFLLANILMGILGFLSARYVVKVSKVPAAILLPVIVVLSVIGSYAMSNTMFNVYVMVVFGGIGYLMRKLDFPPAPTVLALILGTMAEKNLSQAILMSKVPILEYFFTRPLCIVLMLLIIASVFAPLFSRYMSRRMKTIYGENTPDVKIGKDYLE